MSPRPSLTPVQAGERITNGPCAPSSTTCGCKPLSTNMKRWPKRHPSFHWSHEKHLATTSREVDRRTHNQRQRRIKEARFPFRKELAD
ncbi:MAG: hypothetical protein R3A44_00610 [Caldilineaceae bacterium]